MGYWPDGYNGDSLGIQRTKSSAALHAVALGNYQASVDWLKRFIARFGYVVLSVDLDAELGFWRFRVEDACIRVPHDLVQRLENCLDEIHVNEITVRRKRGDD